MENVPLTNEPYIVYIDDDIDDISLFKEFFKQTRPDATLLTFDTAIDFLAFIKKNITVNKQPELIITSINLPAVSGIELATILRNNKPTASIPMVFFCDLPSYNDSRSARQLNIAVCRKPCSYLEWNLVIDNLPDGRIPAILKCA